MKSKTCTLLISGFISAILSISAFAAPQVSGYAFTVTVPTSGANAIPFKVSADILWDPNEPGTITCTPGADCPSHKNPMLLSPGASLTITTHPTGAKNLVYVIGMLASKPNTSSFCPGQYIKYIYNPSQAGAYTIGAPVIGYGYICVSQ